MSVESAVENFFKKAEADLKTVGADFKSVFVKIFGQDALTNLENTAKSLLESELGQAAITDAQSLLPQVAAGNLSLASAIAQLADNIYTSAKSVGKQLDTSVSTIVASAAIAKAQGLLGTTS